MDVKVRVLGSYGGDLGACRSSSYLVDDRVLIDVGGGAPTLGIEGARGVQACAITHSHLDHVGALPSLLDARAGCPTLDAWALPATIAALRTHLFDGALWDDFERIPTPDAPFLRLCEVPPDGRFEAGGLSFRAVEVSHPVPTAAYFVRAGGRAVVVSGDTGPTQALWEAARLDPPAAVFLEVSFPDAMEDIARQTGHLTPRLLVGELAKAPAGTRVLLVHLKPALQEVVREELRPVLAADPRVEVVDQGREYEF